TAAGYVLYTSAPIYDGDRLAGIVLVGTRAAALVPALKEEALADVTFYESGAAVASTFPREGPVAEADLTPPPQLVAGQLNAAGLRETRTLFGRGFSLLYTDLVLRDRSVGLLSVALPNDSIVAAGATSRSRMTLLF